MTVSRLQEAADVYRKAKREGVPPTRAVADHFGVDRSTARRYVSRAVDPSERLDQAAGARSRRGSAN